MPTKRNSLDVLLSSRGYIDYYTAQREAEQEQIAAYKQQWLEEQRKEEEAARNGAVFDGVRSDFGSTEEFAGPSAGRSLDVYSSIADDGRARSPFEQALSPVTDWLGRVVSGDVTENDGTVSKIAAAGVENARVSASGSLLGLGNRTAYGPIGDAANLVTDYIGDLASSKGYDIVGDYLRGLVKTNKETVASYLGDEGRVAAERPIKDYMLQSHANSEALGKSIEQDVQGIKNPFLREAAEVGADLGQNPVMMASMLGGPVGSTLTYGDVYGREYARVIAEGGSEKEADLSASTAAGINSTLAVVPSGRYATKLLPTSVLTTPLKAAVAKGITSGLGEAAQNVVSDIATVGGHAALESLYDKDSTAAKRQEEMLYKDPADFATRSWRAAKAGALPGAIHGGIQGRAESMRDAADLTAKALLENAKNQLARNRAGGLPDNAAPIPDNIPPLPVQQGELFPDTLPGLHSPFDPESAGATRRQADSFDAADKAKAEQKLSLIHI